MNKILCTIFFLSLWMKDIANPLPDPIDSMLMGKSKQKENIEFINPNPIFNVKATCYYPDPEQTDSTPDIVSDGSRINMDDPLSHRWIALSLDLYLKEFNFGDTLEVCGTGVYDGEWIVKDVMNFRWRRKIDFLVGKDDTIDMWKNVTIQKIN